MRICDYCGKSNDDALIFCAGCGVTLDVPKAACTPPVPAQKNPSRTLNAKIATIIFLAFVAAQFFCGYSMDLIATEAAAAQGIHNPHQIDLISETLGPMVLVSGYVLGGAVMLFASLKLIPNYLKDISPTGAAWVWGQSGAIVRGLVIGLIIGMCDQCLFLIAKHHVAYSNLDPVSRMAFTPGLTRGMWFVTVVLLAPPVEEMMFRGILYGGYRKSFGSVWAAVSTTLIFVTLHLPYNSYFVSNIVGIVVMALALLWCRLRWNAIGPAVAAHVGYNFIVAVVVVYWR